MHTNKTRSVIGKEWGITPERLLWIYTAVIRPKLTYGSLVWSHLITKTMKEEMDRLQRIVLLGMTHSLRSTPTVVLENILGLPPLDLFVLGEALKARTRNRKKNDKNWDGLGKKGLCTKILGHREFLDKELEEKELPQELPTDTITAINNWIRRMELKDPDIIIYTDGSKDEQGEAGYGWAACKGDQVIEEESGALGEATVFQSELIAIQSALLWLLSNPHKLKVKSCLIRSDSQAAIHAIFAREVKNKIVAEITKLWEKASRDFLLDLVWIKGHANETGNELADFLAKEGSKKNISGTNPIVPVPYCTIKRKINEMVGEKWQARWEIAEVRNAKSFLTTVDPSCNKKTRKFSKNKLNQLAMAISGHGLYSAHLWHWKNIDPVCKLCKESAETSAHLWNECPALEKLRLTKNSLFMCNRSEEVEYTRIDLYNDVLFYFNSPTVRGLVEDNERLLEAASRRTEETQTTLDDPGTEEDSDGEQARTKHL